MIDSYLHQGDETEVSIVYVNIISLGVHKQVEILLGMPLYDVNIFVKNISIVRAGIYGVQKGENMIELDCLNFHSLMVSIYTSI